ncbi:M23 family metallopeptidase [Croceicoccus estronivorus]|nr:M23 family metallopeptidase [Croceicoccus estronivorus]
MFKSREHFPAGDDAGDRGGPHGGVAALTNAQVIPDAHVIVHNRTRPFSDRVAEWKELAFARVEAMDLAPDLAEDIGSARWFRGLGTFIGLTALALAFWPDFAPLEAAPAMRIDDETRDEFRSQMIMPLALGGDSGRRMGATQAVIPLKSAPERPRVELVATLSPGDSFGRMLQRAGVGSGEAARVSEMVASALPLADIRSGTKVDIVLGRRPAPGEMRPLDSLSFRARFDLELAVDRKDGRLTLAPHRIRVDDTPLRIRGTVGSSLYRSARNAGVPATAVQQYLRTLSSYVDLDSGIGSGDTFDIIVAYKRAETGESEPGQLLFAGLERGGKPKAQLLRWGRDGQFYEASGVGESRSGLMAPVSGRVSSGYGMRRHPILGYKRMHKGMDFRASYGTPIHAVTDGTVVYAGRHGGHGNFVKLNHGGGLATGYAHMSRIAVSNGAHVRRGQVIGYVGSTGLSTGPHLHYEMYRNGQTVNPASVKFVTRSQLTGRELAAFKARLEELRKVEPGAALESLKPREADVAQPVREIDRVDHPREIG